MIEHGFDAVVMLTWSDWRAEPRSNRYHYATRFARHVPVLFVQPWAKAGQALLVQASGLSNIDIVQAPGPLTSSSAVELKALLKARSILKPLIWIYSPWHYQTAIEEFARYPKVFHATEDYFTPSSGLPMDDRSALETAVRRTLRHIDLLVAVSDGVAQSLQRNTGFSGRVMVLPNGCDAQFYFAHAQSAPQTDHVEHPVAIYQGGINHRLDFELLQGVVKLLPHWQFRFCGAVQDVPGWHALQQFANVHHVGQLEPEALAREMSSASVGIIPFIQDRWIENSLPLKAYEYVACGLPVVSVPIDALAAEPHLFALARTASAFAAALESFAPRRYQPDLLALRREAASRMSYDARFEELCGALADLDTQERKRRGRLNVLVLFDQLSADIGTVREHLAAFQKYSQQDISFASCTNPGATFPAQPTRHQIDLSIFDVVVVHYSVRLSLQHHLNECFAVALVAFNGLKVLFIQDEYEHVETTRNWMDRLAFDIVYTCVPGSEVQQVYPRYRFPGTEFLPTLTGYVPEDTSVENLALPLAQRKVLVGYRGRRLAHIYGRLGYEKYQIGLEVRRFAAERGFTVDIEVDDASRIYGKAWYEFLGSARATLGTESGANVFDFDGTLGQKIAAAEASNPDISFEQIEATILKGHDGAIRMNQISPKIFESIQLRTALVLFEGSYSGVVQPGVHFIPLKKDFSNLEDVFAKISDDAFVQRMTDRAYADIVASGKYSYRSFAQAFDADLNKRVFRAKERQLLLGSIYTVDTEGQLRNVLPVLPLTSPAGRSPLDAKTVAPAMQELIARIPLPTLIDQAPDSLAGKMGGLALPMQRAFLWVWKHFPRKLAGPFGPIIKMAQGEQLTASEKNSFLFRLARSAWGLIPRSVQLKIVQALRSN